MTVSIRSFGNDKSPCCKRPMYRSKSALALFVPLKTCSAEANPYASSIAISDYTDKCGVPSKGITSTAHFTTYTILPPFTNTYFHSFLNSAVSSASCVLSLHDIT